MSCLCVCVCLFVCKAYVSSAQGCNEIISNETGSSSCGRCNIGKAVCLGHATGWGTCKHCFHCILGKCTTQRHTVVTAVLSVTPSWPISSLFSLRASQWTCTSLLSPDDQLELERRMFHVCVGPFDFVSELFISQSSVDPWHARIAQQT